MRFVIDGYNLLFMLGETKKSLQANRHLIIRSLEQEFKKLGLKGTLVFDGRHPAHEESGLVYRGPLTVAYSSEHQSADEYILEFLEGKANRSEYFIVSDDKTLTRECRHLGAHTFTLKKFIQLIKHKIDFKIKHSDEKGELTVSKRDLARLLKAFTERPLE